MLNNQKIIRDPIHGNIKLDNFFIKLLETPELQRLYNIKQLGFAHLVFPGAHHTRLEHSLGVYSIASQISESLQLNKHEKKIVMCAALLHDIGHGPFSHTLESILLEKFGVDHVDLTEKLILGEYDVFEPRERNFISELNVNETLVKEGLDKNEIVRVIRGKNIEKPYLGQILNSTIDADQIDYLVRDAFYTGVAYGLVDIDRFLQTIRLLENKIILDRKGVGVIENILMARGLMYSSIYFHKTVRIAELMLSKALEEITELEPFEFFRLTDSEILSSLKNMGDFQHEIMMRLKYRKLFKQAFVASKYDLDSDELNCITSLEQVKIKREKENDIQQKLNIEKGHIIIDIPHLELYRAEPRINKTDISVLDDSKTYNLDHFTPMAKAIRSRDIPDWVIMVITDEKNRSIVNKKVRKILFD